MPFFADGVYVARSMTGFARNINGGRVTPGRPRTRYRRL
jgi:hypothetical protein